MSDRLLQIMGRALLDRLDGRLHVAVAGDDDDLGVGQFLLGLAEDSQTVHVGHAKIGEHDVESQTFRGGGRRPSRWSRLSCNSPPRWSTSATVSA